MRPSFDSVHQCCLNSEGPLFLAIQENALPLLHCLVLCFETVKGSAEMNSTLKSISLYYFELCQVQRTRRALLTVHIYTRVSYVVWVNLWLPHSSGKCLYCLRITSKLERANEVLIRPKRVHVCKVSHNTTILSQYNYIYIYYMENLTPFFLLPWE